ncbi:MAG TPA: LysR family transcriptional regulator [Polyangiales bacterium]
MFELYQVRYFLAVVETGSFTKASQRVGVSQPTLSAGIQKLEQTLEAQLFDRTKRRVFLTSEGTRFVEHAKAIMAEAQRALTGLKTVPKKQVLSVGVLTTISAWEVQRLIGDFMRTHPKVIVELYEGTERELNTRLERETLDVALTLLRPENRARSRELYDEGYSLALSARHPLAHKPVIQVAELADEAMIVRTRCEMLSETSRFFTHHHVRPRLVYRTEQDERALALVGASLGITVMPDHYRAESVARVPLLGFEERRTVALVRDRKRPGPLVQNFSEFAASQAWQAG